MVTINLGRREAVFFGAILLTFLVVGLVVAYGGNQPTVMGHSADEVEGSFVSMRKHILSYDSVNQELDGSLDLEELTGHAVPENARYVVLRAQLNVNCGANDNCVYRVYASEYPSGGDFTGFDSIDNYALAVDAGNNPGITESINQATIIVPLRDSSPEVGWMLNRATTTSDGSFQAAQDLNLNFWIEGYYT